MANFFKSGGSGGSQAAICCYVSTATGTVAAGGGNITFGTVTIDTNSGFSSTTYTIQRAGKYLVNGTLVVSPSGASGGTVFMSLTGTQSSIGSSTGTPASGQIYTMSVSMIGNFSVGNTIQMNASHNTGTTVSIQGAQLSISYLGT